MIRQPCGRCVYTEQEIKDMMPKIYANLRASFEIEGHKISDTNWEKVCKIADADWDI